MRRDELIRPVPELLKEHAELAPRRVAYADSSRSVTYAELERRTRALAAYLTRTGLRRGDRVAICLGNCVEAVESCLAVLRAGMVGVPLNPRSSDAELAHFLQDSGAAHVITELAGGARGPARSVAALRRGRSRPARPGRAARRRSDQPAGPGARRHRLLPRRVALRPHPPGARAGR
ncbi:acyl-CoA synthetase (AMP-forming)/AMP-acid ligase II [Streptomyces sp. V4I8]|uniref:AMP-binding protein n=1 Tax=Streptomyces sp. V4I8 TaxID=3156469 RepID=UPI0035151229